MTQLALVGHEFEAHAWSTSQLPVLVRWYPVEHASQWVPSKPAAQVHAATPATTAHAPPWPQLVAVQRSFCTQLPAPSSWYPK